MKIASLIALVILTGFHSRAQVITYTNLVVPAGQTTSLTLDGGQVARVLTVRFTAWGGYMSVTLGDSSFSYKDTELSAALPIVAGPAKISLFASTASAGCFCTIEITSPAAQLMPSTGVVVPADSGGPVSIILESSVDLVNWTAALPGTYGTSTTNRFFRVRAVRAS